MTDPLIVVEGSLRLPSLRPLADPRLRFGREWSIAHNRSLHAQGEFERYGATFETAYIKPFSLVDAASRYRPLSIWATLTDRPARRSMFDFSKKKDAASGPNAGIDPVVAPIHLDVKPPVTTHTLEFRFPNALKVAIALACAALAAWLVYTHQQHARDNAPDAARSFEGAHSSNATPVTLPFVTPAQAATSQADTSTSHDGLVPVPNGTADGRAALNASTPALASGANALKSPSPSPANAVAKPAPRRAVRIATWKRHTASQKGGSRKHRDIHVVAAHGVRPTRAISNGGNGAMSTEALYSMLQHSPTLDSNAGATAVRANSRDGAAQ